MTEVECARCGLVAPVTLARAPGAFARRDIAVIGIDRGARCPERPTPTDCPDFQSAIDAAIGTGRLFPRDASDAGQPVAVVAV
jgi:hypothetical protein